MSHALMSCWAPRSHHGAAGVMLKASAGLLLEGGGDERRRGGFGPGTPLTEKGTPRIPPPSASLLLVGFRTFPAVEGRSESPMLRGRSGKIHVQRPVLAAQAQISSRSPPGGLEPPGIGRDLFHRRGRLVAHDAVQDAPGLLGVLSPYLFRRGDELNLPPTR